MKYKQRFKDMPIDTSWTYEEDREWFIKELSDLAFGEDTIERGYSMEEVIEKLKNFLIMHLNGRRDKNENN